jgi:hypothetical protein
MSKIDLPLNKLDKNGLIGPHDGKVSVDYVFCIPQSDLNIQTVEKISSKIKIDRNNNFFCRGNNMLTCIGNTGHKKYKRTLRKLSNLDFVNKIESVDWE